MKGRAGSVVTVCLCVAVLAAGSTSKPSVTTAAATSGCALTSWNAATTGVVNASNTPGGTLMLWGSNDPIDSLDPARTYFVSVWNLLRIWQRGLTAFAPEPGTAGLGVVADLATSPGQASNANRTWTYHLRPGLRFQDGEAITSTEVKYAIERLFATDVITGGPAMYYIDLLDGGQHYLGPYRDRSHTGLRSIVTPDPSTIVFHLSRPFADFDYLMALPSATPVPARMDTGADYQKNPVSSGPYKIQSYDQGRSLVLVRNGMWERQTDPLRKALPDRVVVSLTGSDDARSAQEMSEPSISFDGGIPPSAPMAAKVANDPALRCHADDVAVNFTRYLSIEQMVAPFDNVHCRRAVEFAIDKAALVPVWGGPLQASLTGTMLTPNLATYEPGYDPYPGGPGGTGDLARARVELRLCGHPHGFSTKLATMDSGPGYMASTVEAAALAKVGITVTLVPFQFSEFYPWIGTPAHIRQFHIGLEILGWGPDFPTEYGFWESLVDSRAIKAVGNTNYPELRDPGVQADLALAASTPDAGARLAAYRDLAHRVMSDAVYVPLVSLKSLYYRNPHLTNVYFQPALGAYDLMALGVS